MLCTVVHGLPFLAERMSAEEFDGITSIPACDLPETLHYLAKERKIFSP